MNLSRVEVAGAAGGVEELHETAAEAVGAFNRSVNLFIDGMKHK